MHRLYMWIKHQFLQWQINKDWSAALHEDWIRERIKEWEPRYLQDDEDYWFYKSNGNW